MSAPYDPQKAHDYYEKHKQLKGRHPSGAKPAAGGRSGAGSPGGGSAHTAAEKRKAAARARTIRLTHKLHSLQVSLKEATEALAKKKQAASKSRATAKKTARKNSDGKTTAKERQQAKEYRQKHKSEIAAKAKKGGSSSGGGSHKKVSEMTQTELTTRITKIRSAISSAKKQIQQANSLSHSTFVDDTDHLIHRDGAKGR